MPFADICGHQGPISVLKSAIENGRVSHAYLFEGPANIGKTLTALVFAKALMCGSPLESGEPCDACAICNAVDRENHPDFLIVRPTSRLEIEDEEGQKAVADIEGSMITKDAIAHLISEANLRVSSARRKVFIVSSAEAMNPASANRLLKTLEEPPGLTTIILTAPSTSALLPTIVSRCQLLRFGPVPTDDVQVALEREAPLGDPALMRSIAALSGGRPGWAIRLMEHPDTLKIRKDILDIAVGLK
ncbi:MAG TPA: DNA polymerase III subunit delta', partial [Armatimonadota bacterium]|nr:DNA polymerase III subunit delta' [Armatimonadota bacterium]